MWGGRFEKAPDASFYEFERSWSFDRRLLSYELAVDRAWARALVGVSILTETESKQIIAALDEIEKRAEAEPGWLDASTAEDVHHFAETALIERLGVLGAKLHTGRSRNEMCVTEFRMFIKEAAAAMSAAVAELIEALLERAEHYLELPMPGMTHLQHAQPILVSHFLLAHAEGFFHDADRLAFAANTNNACPMGAGALAGCGFPVDRMAIARDLGFARITRNSLDSVSRRDFALDYLYALSVLASHLSRLAEDFVLFASQEFGFVTLPDEYSTGSSLMPQKKNPDAWELIRGKSGRVTAALISLLVTLKGLPTSYQRDLQEDKEALFSAHDQALAMTQIAAGTIAATRFNEARLREAASDPSLLATEMADYLVTRGVPFRQAHEIVGKAIREAERLGTGIAQLPAEALKALSPVFGPDLAEALTVEASLARRSLPGGTAPESVRTSLADFRSRLAALMETAAGVAR
jgi:argininosuccinate lyase